MKRVFQVTGVAVCLAQLILLAATYQNHGSSQGLFISDNLDDNSMVYFNIGLGVCVVFQGVLAIVWIAVCCFQSTVTMTVGIASVTVALCSWCVLSTYGIETPQHPPAVFCYVSATVIYTLILVIANDVATHGKRRCARFLVFVYLPPFAFGAVFISYYCKAYTASPTDKTAEQSAILWEWISFMCMTCANIIFYSTHTIPEFWKRGVWDSRSQYTEVDEGQP
jgi:hypothetical protein